MIRLFTGVYCLLWIAFAHSTTVAQGEETASLRLKVVYDGEAPTPKTIDCGRDPFCGSLNLVEDQLLVAADGGIKNLVLMYDKKRSKAKPSPTVQVAPEAVHQLEIKDCMFAPKILVARPGQTIEVINSDATGHSVNFMLLNHPSSRLGTLIAQANTNKIELSMGVEEPSPMPVVCNIHPWMKSFVVVLDHPYVGVSDAGGVIEINNLPVGEVSFRVWHELADRWVDEATVDGKKQKWGRGRLEIQLHSGVNDLGVVKLAADQFKL